MQAVGGYKSAIEKCKNRKVEGRGKETEIERNNMGKEETERVRDSERKLGREENTLEQKLETAMSLWQLKKE